MRIMELVGLHEMTNRPQPVQLLGQSLVELDRRMLLIRHAHRIRNRACTPGKLRRWVVVTSMLFWGSVLALAASLTGLIAFGSAQLYAELASLGFAISLFTAICAAEARQ